MNIEDNGTVRFPDYAGSVVNMMPIVMGDAATIPACLHGYLPMIERAGFAYGAVVYLTVHESLVDAGQSQRRSGVHTDATSQHGWGGGGWGKVGGVWVASTDGACRAWDEGVAQSDVDGHGGLLRPVRGTERRFEACRLYAMNDSTPHEALPATTTHHRQFFRLVGPDIGAWFAQHSTPSPFGVMPQAKVIAESKFT
jgi:hypothetical protein